MFTVDLGLDLDLDLDLSLSKRLKVKHAQRQHYFLTSVDRSDLLTLADRYLSTNFFDISCENQLSTTIQTLPVNSE